MDRYHKRCPFDIGFVLERPHRKASGQRKGRGNVRGEDPDSQGSQLRFRPGDAER